MIFCLLKEYHTRHCESDITSLKPQTLEICPSSVMWFLGRSSSQLTHVSDSRTPSVHLVGSQWGTTHGKLLRTDVGGTAIAPGEQSVPMSAGAGGTVWADVRRSSHSSASVMSAHGRRRLGVIIAPSYREATTTVTGSVPARRLGMCEMRIFRK